jgi:hypothetical protein
MQMSEDFLAPTPLENSTTNSTKEEARSETRGPASEVQIEALNSSRAHPEAAMHYTPQGPGRDEGLRQKVQQLNADIDQQIEAFRARMRERDGHAQLGFEMGANYKGGRDF